MADYKEKFDEWQQAARRKARELDEKFAISDLVGEGARAAGEGAGSRHFAFSTRSPGPVKGGAPVSASKSRTPKAYQSADGPTKLLVTCSGAM